MIKKTHVQLVEPKLPEPFPNIPVWWKEPINGIEIPKHPTRNLEWRAELMRDAENDITFQQYLFSCCEKSILFWMNAFVWTYRQFIVDETYESIKEAIEFHIEAPVYIELLKKGEKRT